MPLEPYIEFAAAFIDEVGILTNISGLEEVRHMLPGVVFHRLSDLGARARELHHNLGIDGSTQETVVVISHVLSQLAAMVEEKLCLSAEIQVCISSVRVGS